MKGIFILLFWEKMNMGGRGDMRWEGKDGVSQHTMPAHEEQNCKEQVNKINKPYKDN